MLCGRPKATSKKRSAASTASEPYRSNIAKYLDLESLGIASFMFAAVAITPPFLSFGLHYRLNREMVGRPATGSGWATCSRKAGVASVTFPEPSRPVAARCWPAPRSEVTDAKSTPWPSPGCSTPRSAAHASLLRPRHQA